MKYILLLFILFFSLISCGQKENSQSTPQKEVNPFENFKNKWFLPHKLEEISGLSWYAPNILASVNDEKGNIYLYDLEKEEIFETIDFGGKDDYEGIAYQKPFFYIVNSKGKLFIYNEENEQIDTYKLPFNADNDIEGLCIYPPSHLLVALKGDGGLEGKKTDFKGVYKVNIEDPSQVELTYSIKDKNKVSPSGIYFDKNSGKVMVLSHRSKELIYIDHTSGEITKQIKLSKKIFEQPEGICMSPEGRIFISNEKGENLKGNILEF